MNEFCGTGQENKGVNKQNKYEINENNTKNNNSKRILGV
jgi:hypothetical protein